MMSLARARSPQPFQVGPPARFRPSSLSNLAAWYRHGQGITSSGSAVSQWSDQSANAWHLLQASGASQPALQAGGAIRFDNGAGDTDFLKTAAFTLAQPFEAFLLLKQVTWNALGNTPRIMAGNTNDVTILYQVGVTPNIRQYAGVMGADNPGLALNTYGVLSASFNGLSSFTRVNNNAPVAASAGTQTMTGLTIGANGNGASAYADIEVKEIVLTGALTPAQRAAMIAYMARVGGLVI